VHISWTQGRRQKKFPGRGNGKNTEK